MLAHLKMKEVVVNMRLIQGKGQYSAFFSINTIRFQNGSNAFHRFNFFTVAEIFNFCAINGDNAVPIVKKVNKYFSNVALGGRGVIEMKLLNACICQPPSPYYQS